MVDKAEEGGGGEGGGHGAPHKEQEIKKPCVGLSAVGLAFSQGVCPAFVSNKGAN